MRPALVVRFRASEQVRSGSRRFARDRSLIFPGISEALFNMALIRGLLQALVEGERPRRLARAISPYEPGRARMAHYSSVDRKIDTNRAPKDGMGSSITSQNTPAATRAKL